jgi:hypothetical protein
VALPALTLITGGVHHATAEGTVDVGAGNGQVPAFGVAQLMTVDLTMFDEVLRRDPRFEDQLYITAIARATTISAVTLDAVPFVDDAAGVPITLRLNVTITADTALYLLLEAHHSTGR